VSIQIELAAPQAFNADARPSFRQDVANKGWQAGLAELRGRRRCLLFVDEVAVLHAEPDRADLGRGLFLVCRATET